MRIGIDIDDTISNTSSYLLEEAVRYDRKCKNKGIKDNTKYDFCDFFNWEKQDKRDFFDYICEYELHDVPVKPHAKEVINKLKKEGNKIYIITRRDSNDFKDPYKDSKKWLSKQKIKYDKLIVSSKDKGKACKELEVDLFIDDMPFNCERVLEEEVKVLMFDSPYNKEETRFDRVASWEEIYDIVSR